ncbi:GNAT family N-acetyltransferase [Paenibacillus odorifer]|uniref:GNAT family N-acetyltransferase n=1 Tax=Paenibacillus odorifer TaxID=189426 RepID=UPI00096C9E52|nr:GNAT family N-acetyltransferase [Paenibacillus odorifer]OME14935.1 GNAT family N-acetyltransferase [Paenibacillus odorifer]
MALELEGVKLNNQSVVFPALHTARIELRILNLEDANVVFRHFSDEEVTRYMDIEPCKDLIEAEEIIQYHLEDLGCRWGMFEKANNEFIGTCGYHYLRRVGNEFTAEVGYDLSRAFWGKGYMYEVMKEIIDLGFLKLGFTSIDATVEPENVRSIMLLERLGFEQDAELRDQLLYFVLKRNR